MFPHTNSYTVTSKDQRNDVAPCQNGVAVKQNDVAPGQNGAADKKPLPLPDTLEPVERSWLQRYAFVITMLLNPIIDGLGASVSSQFKYSFFHNQYSAQLRHYNATRSSVCGEEAVLDPHVQEIENRISAESANWGLYVNYATILPMLVASLLIGMKSDQIGRRFLFLLPFFSSFVHYAILAAVIRLNLHYGYTLIGSFISAASGGRIGMSFAGFALVSDTHGKKAAPGSQPVTTDKTSGAGDGSASQGKANIQNRDKESTVPSDKGSHLNNVAESESDDLDMRTEKARMFKIVGLDVATRFTSGAVSFSTGYVIQYAGYFYSIVIVLIAKSLLFVFAYCFISETGVQKKTTNFWAPLRQIGAAFKDQKKRLSLILCYLGIFFGMFGFCEEMEILRTYEMSPPFCLDAIQLGWLSSIRVVKGLFSVPLLWFWKRVHASEATMSAIGFIFYALGALVLATIRKTWVFFVYPFVTIPGGLSMSVAKAIISRLIGRSALASSFAVMLAGEELFMFGGNMASNYMYQTFVYTLPTASFYAASASFVVAAILMGADPMRRRCSSAAMTSEDPEATETTVDPPNS